MASVVLSQLKKKNDKQLIKNYGQKRQSPKFIIKKKKKIYIYSHPKKLKTEKEKKKEQQNRRSTYPHSSKLNLKLCLPLKNKQIKKEKEKEKERATNKYKEERVVQTFDCNNSSLFIFFPIGGD